MLLPGAHHAHPVAARAQALHHALRGHGHAVDFRGISLGDEEDAQWRQAQLIPRQRGREGPRGAQHVDRFRLHFSNSRYNMASRPASA